MTKTNTTPNLSDVEHAARALLEQGVPRDVVVALLHVVGDKLTRGPQPPVRPRALSDCGWGGD